MNGRNDLADVDLALIIDVEWVAVCLELKWSIDPAEPREVIEKSQEISRGIEQLALLSTAGEDDPISFIDSLDLAPDYELHLIVCSRNSIGAGRSYRMSLQFSIFSISLKSS